MSANITVATDSAETEYHAARIRAVQRRTLWTLSIATILGGLGVGATLSVGALLLAEVSGNDAISGLASATFNGGAALAGIPLARIAARHGRRRALVTGSLVAMCGAGVAILGAAIEQWWVLALGLAMLGVASAVQLLSRFAAADLAQPKNRARDLSLVVWAITVGAVVGPNLLGPGALAGEMLGLTPLAGVFVFPIVAQGLAALLTWILLRPDPLLLSRALPDPTAEQMAAGAESKKRAAPARALLGNRRAQILTIFAIAMSQAIMVALMAMTPLHLMHHEGTPQLVGFTLSLHIAGMYGLSPLIGFLAGRIGSLQTMAIGWVVLLSSVVCSYVSGASHLTVQVAMILLGVGWGLVTVAGAALLTEITPAEERTKWQGRSDTFMSAAGAVAGVISGVIFAMSDFSFLAVVSGGLLALGAVASLMIASHQRKATRSASEIA